MKKKIHYLFVFLVLYAINGNAQTAAKNEIFNSDFNWTITIPDGFESVSSEEHSKFEEKGKEMIEDTYGEKIVSHAKSIFLFRKDRTTYFEANYQPFDPAVDGDYLDMCKVVNELLHETFKSQMPGSKIDAVKSTETIDGLEFQTFSVKVELPNKVVMTVLMYNHLFEKKDLSINILYLDDLKGAQMLDSFRKSKFRK